MPEPQTWEERLAAQQKLYGQYVAKGNIVVDGALAFTEGHPVPASMVGKDNKVDPSQVEKVKTEGASA